MSGPSDTKESGPNGSKGDQERFQGGTSAEENLSTFGQQSVTVALDSTEEDISKTSRGKGLPRKLSNYYCSPRQRGHKPIDFSYEKGHILQGHEDKETEYKSFIGCDTDALPWKVMYKAKTYICGWLNSAKPGTLYFGVADGNKDSPYWHGQILGLDVEKLKDPITTALQDVLNNHIVSDMGDLEKGGDMDCVNLYFVPVKIEGACTTLNVIEIEVERDWMVCKDKVYYCKTWDEVSSKDRSKRNPNTKKNLRYWFNVKQTCDRAAIRTTARTEHILEPKDVHYHIKSQLQQKYQNWLQRQRNAAHADPLAELQRIAASEGFILVHNSGGGNCMFHALSNQLHLKGICTVSHKELRKSAVEFLRNNPRLPVSGKELSEFLVHNEYPSWDEYLKRMANDGEWGNDLILVAVANRYGVSIRVISNLSHDHERTFSPERPVFRDKQLVVGHVSELHYVSLRPKLVPTPSSLHSFVEFANWAKLTRLLMYGGQEVLRRVFDEIHPPANLAADLHANAGILRGLRILNTQQWDLLSRSDVTKLDSHNFDITLLSVLLQHISGLCRPHTGWSAMPPSHDTSLEADIVRINRLRNECAHGVTTAIDTESFSRKWQEVTVVLLRLGLQPDEVDDMLADHNVVEERVNTQHCYKKLRGDVEIITKNMRQVQEESQAVEEPDKAEEQSLQKKIERLEHLEQVFQMNNHLFQEETTPFVRQEDFKKLEATVVQMQKDIQSINKRQAEQASLVTVTRSAETQWINNSVPQEAAGAALQEPSAASQNLQFQPLRIATEQQLQPQSFQGQVSASNGGTVNINAPLK